ncbi:hypothetical protein CHUAL_006115 [Chamberlinius hualienensis]
MWSTLAKSLSATCYIRNSVRLRVSNINRLSTVAETEVKVDEENVQLKQVLYDEHISTSLFQKILLAAGSGAMSLFDPTRDDMIAIFGETTGSAAASRMRQKMLRHDEGRLILEEKPRLNTTTVDFNYLMSLPEDSLGGVYAKFFQRNGVSPDTRRPVNFLDDKELAYVIQRYREIHDVVHAVLYMPTNMLGEVTVKWIEGIQTGLPMCVLGGLFGAYRLSKKQRELYVSSYLPWAIKCGYESEIFMNIYYEKHWEEPIDQFRRRLNVPDLQIQTVSR